MLRFTESQIAPIALAIAAMAWTGVNVAAQDPAVALRERYLGVDGRPSPEAYAQAHDIAPVPGTETFAWQVVFRFAYRAADQGALEEADPIYTDCYFIRRRQYTAAYAPEPVWDGRVYQADSRLIVAEFTSKGEKVSGHVDEMGSVRVASPSALDDSKGERRQSEVRYNPFTGQLWRRGERGIVLEEQRFYLPLPLINGNGISLLPHYRISRVGKKEIVLVARRDGAEFPVARCAVGERPSNVLPGYAPILGRGASMAVDEQTVIVEYTGELLTDMLGTGGAQLVSNTLLFGQEATALVVEIDGRFDEWRSIRGITDPGHDIPKYLQYNPDTDLLEFKVASDNEHLYFYTRVAGRHGNTGADRDRYYFYVYIDADRNPATGYIPTRDDDCYYGVALGDDCEAQFEFMGGRFVKTFFGFAGASTEEDVLAGRVTLGPSWYNKQDEAGRLRDAYKVEYVRQGDEIKITEDFAEGTTDDIVIALSPDGSECEMRAALSGFLRDKSGNPIIAAGQHIDLAAGVEASGQIHGNDRWGADSTAVIRGYVVGK